MSDFEQRLSAALAEGAEGAPGAVGLAAAARGRAARKRRAKLAGTAALVALAIGVPSAVVAVSGDDPTEREPASDPVANDDDARDGYRIESWHGVTIEVPESWEYGSMSQWCAGAGSAETPRVERPGGAQTLMLCTPGSSYGAQFAPAEGRGPEWPVAAQHNEGWPDGAYVGATTVRNVIVTVVAPDAAVAATVLGSVRPIGPEGDPNGCRARLEPATPPEGGLSVCRYDEDGALEQSEALYAADAGEAVRALQAAPPPGDCDAGAGSQPHPVVLMEGAGISARVDLVAGCPRVTVDGDVRELTPDVLYWALSPGWSGDATGLPLPPELRRE